MRILLIVFFFCSFLDASIKSELILNKYVSKDNQGYKNTKSINLKKELFKNFNAKFHIDNSLVEDKTFYVKVTCEVDKIISSNVKYKSNFDTVIFEIDKNTPEEVFFNFEYEKEKELNLRYHILNEFEYEYILKNEGIIFGLTYGIIFSAFLYNFVIFLYTFQRSFLYYSFMQLSLLVILSYITMLSSQTFVSHMQQMFIDFLETFCILLTILFSKEILNTKKYMRNINKLLNFLIYINVVDLISIFIFKESLLYDYIPRSFVISLLVLSGVIALFKGQKTAIFYFIGWFVLFLSLIIAEHELLGVDELYVIHIGFPLESLILSFALGYKLKQTVDEKKEKEKILVHQSKLASMGEMINNIAHQWRQPLTHLSFINMDLQMASEDSDLSKKYLIDKLNESNNQIDFMSETIDSFKDFYKPQKEKELFYISDATQKAIDIIKPSLESANIKFAFKIQDDKKVKAYENEYSQVVLNFLTNAKDVLISRNIENPEIQIKCEIKNNRSFLSVSDNANGIENDLLEKIFDPYFTTKDKSSGIGLYMSRIIIESHLKGEISVSNTLKGACFSIKV